MAFESNNISFIGNLTDDPSLRFTPNGVAVANFTVANNTKKGDDQETTFLDVTVWRDQAENAAESLHKGDRVVVLGSIKKRSYENKEGQTVWVTEIQADEVAPSLKWAQAPVQRNNGRSSTGSTVPDDDEVPF